MAVCGKYASSRRVAVKPNEKGELGRVEGGKGGSYLYNKGKLIPELQLKLTFSEINSRLEDHANRKLKGIPRKSRFTFTKWLPDLPPPPVNDRFLTAQSPLVI